MAGRGVTIRGRFIHFSSFFFLFFFADYVFFLAPNPLAAAHSYTPFQLIPHHVPLRRLDSRTWSHLYRHHLGLGRAQPPSALSRVQDLDSRRVSSQHPKGRRRCCRHLPSGHLWRTRDDEVRFFRFVLHERKSASVRVRAKRNMANTLRKEPTTFQAQDSLPDPQCLPYPRFWSSPRVDA